MSALLAATTSGGDQLQWPGAITLSAFFLSVAAVAVAWIRYRR